MIQRSLQPIIEKWLFRKKIIIIYGARQVGKTTLAKTILKQHGSPEDYYNCEIPSVRALLESKEPARIKKEFGSKKLIILDEAQFVPDIGLILKIISDSLSDLQIIATGSSSFELAQKTSEPLTGRSLAFILYPFSIVELSTVYKSIDRTVLLDSWLRFGTYPEIALSNHQDAKILLNDLANKYLYKDIFTFENLRKGDVIYKLLQLLAYQIGNEVSYHELSTTLKINVRTITRYIDLLEKAFVIFRLKPYSRNLRKEITKKNKIYFYDVGIRNSIIQQFAPMELRPDKGALWENYLIVERMKYLQTQALSPNQYFWRTTDQQEIDYIEEMDGQLYAYEFKWKIKKKRVPIAFTKAYPDAKISWVDLDNFDEFLG